MSQHAARHPSSDGFGFLSFPPFVLPRPKRRVDPHHHGIANALAALHHEVLIGRGTVSQDTLYVEWLAKHHDSVHFGHVQYFFVQPNVRESILSKIMID